MKTPTKISIILLAAAALTACAPFRVGDIRVGHTPARKIAKDPNIPGKGVDGQCLPFAMSLHKRFQAAGIPSKVIVYRYESLGTLPGAFSGSAAYGASRARTGAHAAVAYNDDGRTYLMDNQAWMPQWVANNGAMGLAQQFSGMDIAVLDARVLNTAAPRKARTPSSPERVRPEAPATPVAPAYFTYVR